MILSGKSIPILILAIVFIAVASAILYCYPMPQVTWDGESYIQYSDILMPNLRPLGYAIFLRVLYVFSHSLSFVVYVQFLGYFCSVIYLLDTVNKLKKLTKVQYITLGVLLFLEPAALYHCNTILSDVVFSALTYVYIASLLRFTANRRSIHIITHIVAMVLCIEVRHSALFYPIFSVVFLCIFIRSYKSVLLNAVLVAGAFAFVYFGNVAWNKRIYGVAVYSPFSGWTAANNALYVTAATQINAKDISEPDVRRMHVFCKNYLDTGKFKVAQVGSGYLWDAASPLQVIRKNLEDSLLKSGAHSDYTYDWYLLAPLYSKYGSYIERNYPVEYFRHFVKPNINTLIRPEEGEMSDYYIAVKDISPDNLKKYGLTVNMLQCREQIFKDGLNTFVLRYYQLRLALFLIAGLLLVTNRKSKTASRSLNVTLYLFTGAFFVSMLVSSWFIFRYLLPILPLMTIVIFLAVLQLTSLAKHSS